MTTERITIIVEEQGTRVVKRRLGDIGDEATASAQGVNLLRSALIGIGAGLIIRQLVGIADAYTNIQNRLRLVTEGTDQLNAVTRELLSISNATRTSFEGNAELFNRVSLAVRGLGTSQQEVLDFTESLNQAILISGANAKEASTGIIQLSQALASGRLQGDELRSVMEQLPKVADVIAKQMGVTRGQLRQLGSESKITSDIILKGFQSAREELAEQFKRVVPTVGQAFQILRNSVVGYVGSLNDASGITAGLSKLIIAFARNIDTLARVIGAAGLTASLFLAISALRTFTVILAANPLGALLLGITFLISLLVTFSDKIGLSSDRLATLRDFAVAVFERIVEGGRLLIVFFQTQFGGLSDVLTSVFGDWEFSLEGFIRASAIILDRYIGFWRGTINAIIALYKNLGPTLIDLGTQAMNGLIGIVESGIDGILALLQTLGNIIKNIGLGFQLGFENVGRAIRLSLQGEVDTAAEVAKNANEIFKNYFTAAFTDIPGQIGRNFEKNAETDLLPRLTNVAEGAANNTGKAMVEGFVKGFDEITVFEDSVNSLFDRADQIAAKRLADQKNITGVDLSTVPAGGGAPLPQDSSRDIQEILDKLQKEQELLRLTNEQREVQNELLKIENSLKKDGIDLSENQRMQIETELQRVQLLEQVSRALDEVRGTQIDLIAAQTELNEQVAAGNITLEQATQAYRKLQNQVLETSTTAEAGWTRGMNRILDKVNDTGSAVEDTLVNAFNNAEDALVEFVQSGEFNFSGLVDSILADLTRLLARQAISGLLGMLGGPAGMLGSMFAGAATARANGGSVAPGGLYQVGERGRELFVPDKPGTIVPAQQTAAIMSGAAAPQVNVHITNVTDPNEVAGALATPNGEKAILNVIRRNRKTMQGIS